MLVIYGLAFISSLSTECVAFVAPVVQGVCMYANACVLSCLYANTLDARTLRTLTQKRVIVDEGDGRCIVSMHQAQIRVCSPAMHL